MRRRLKWTCQVGVLVGLIMLLATGGLQRCVHASYHFRSLESSAPALHATVSPRNMSLLQLVTILHTGLLQLVPPSKVAAPTSAA